MVAAAIVGSAVVGGVVSSKASSKANKTAKQTAATNNALQQQVYDRNAAALAPYQAAGLPANRAVGALLGFGDTAKPAFTSNGVNYYANGSGGYTTSPPASTGALAEQNAAFENFRNSTGYKDQFAEGQRAVTSALGNRGLLDSGAALKALTKYGQSQANQSFNDYYGKLVGQQQVGLAAASAQAGVGQNFANAVSQNNNNASAASQNAALSNAANINSVLQSGLSAYSLSQGMGSSYGSNAYGIQGSRGIY